MKLTTAAEQFIKIRPTARFGVVAFLAFRQAEDTSQLEAADLISYLHDLVRRGYAVDTVFTYRTQTNAFFRWLVDRDLVPFGPDALNQVFTQQYAALPARITAGAPVPDEVDVRALIEAARAAEPTISLDTPRGRRQRLSYLRNIAIVEVLRATGIRPGELVSLRRCDLDEARQCAYAPDGRRLYFDLESWGALARYLAARNDPVGYPLLIWQSPVFARHDPASAGKDLAPMTTRNVIGILVSLRVNATTSARGLRARFAHRLLEATTDERGTARLLGLKHEPSVRRYR